MLKIINIMFVIEDIIMSYLRIKFSTIIMECAMFLFVKFYLPIELYGILLCIMGLNDEKGNSDLVKCCQLTDNTGEKPMLLLPAFHLRY